MAMMYLFRRTMPIIHQVHDVDVPPAYKKIVSVLPTLRARTMHRLGSALSCYCYCFISLLFALTPPEPPRQPNHSFEASADTATMPSPGENARATSAPPVVTAGPSAHSLAFLPPDGQKMKFLAAATPAPARGDGHGVQRPTSFSDRRRSRRRRSR